MFIKYRSIILTAFLTSFCFSSVGFAQVKKQSISLPAPYLYGKVSLEEALDGRRSVRQYSEDSLSMSEVSQLLWAAQGITERFKTPRSSWRDGQKIWGRRTAPSAGGLYPIELYIAVGKVKGLTQGLYKYDPRQHAIINV
jgi:hypothetical protein